MARKMSKMKLIIGLFASIAGILLLKHAFLLLLFGMLPAVVALIVDRSARHTLAKTVICFNLAGVIPTMSNILTGAANPSSISELLGTPSIWLIVYGAAGMGWAVYWSAPLVTYTMIKADHLRAKLLLDMRAKRLVDEWGPEIKRRAE